MLEKIITNVKTENFLYGGLVYHHREIEDKNERQKIFNNIIDTKLGKGATTSEEIDNIYQLKEQLEFIKNSQNLTSIAIDKTLEILNSKNEEHPLEKIYKDDKNIFIANGTIIIPSDVIVFISQKGLIGDVYNQNIENQELCILYRYIENLDINIGEVFDYKLIKNFKEYFKIIEEV